MPAIPTEDQVNPTSVNWIEIPSFDGRSTISVTSDYLRNNNGTYVRGNPRIAESCASQFAARLPSPEEVDWIYQSAQDKYHLTAVGQPSSSNYKELVEKSDDALQNIMPPEDRIAAGHLKTVVIKNGLYSIHGARWRNGMRVQTFNGGRRHYVNGDSYRDYSQGIRLVRDVT